MSTRLTVPPEFDEASRDERIAFVEALWNRIAEAPDEVSVPAEHRRILDERLDAAPTGASWEQVRDRELKRLRRA
ncbi:addiction module protein [Algiphilus sp.]|uniref:addiction module protein n=1 Tax=Algiphilus sp. TaxID=1872431 RepID=UPI003BAC72C5